MKLFDLFLSKKKFTGILTKKKNPCNNKIDTFLVLIMI